jgi:hypothetical protein
MVHPFALAKVLKGGPLSHPLPDEETEAQRNVFSKHMQPLLTGPGRNNLVGPTFLVFSPILCFPEVPRILKPLGLKIQKQYKLGGEEEGD